MQRLPGEKAPEQARQPERGSKLRLTCHPSKARGKPKGTTEAGQEMQQPAAAKVQALGSRLGSAGVE